MSLSQLKRRIRIWIIVSVTLVTLVALVGFRRQPLTDAERHMLGTWQAEGDGWFKPLNPPLLYELVLTADRGFVYRYDVRGGGKSTSHGSWRVDGNVLFLKTHVPFWRYLRECYRQGGVATIPESKLRLEGTPEQLQGGRFPLERIAIPR